MIFWFGDRARFLFLSLDLQVVQRLQELFSQTKDMEAAELAAEFPQGILRTVDTVARFQVLKYILSRVRVLFSMFQILGILVLSTMGLNLIC
ncbi:hypothetical protein Sjap_011197 [Stephania japonica]|uniref:Uncharacterized protein n=1 Tax=Stephania japonica TaxID=461633 RepID=A0AAP0JCW7_9MAGN